MMHDTPSSEVVTLVAEVGRRMQANTAAITKAIGAMLADGVAGVGDDPDLRRMLFASVEGNITTIFHVLANDIPIDNVQPTTAAVEYAIRSAQRGVSGNSLRRAYHVGQDDLQAAVFAEIQALDCSAELKLLVLNRTTQVVNRYVDWITQFVLSAYEAERQRWVEASGNMSSVLINRLLNHQVVDSLSFKRETDYSLDQHHLGLVVWAVDDHPHDSEILLMENFVHDLARAGGVHHDPITTAIDRSTVWAWLPLGSSADGFDLEAARDVAAKTDHCRVSIGLPSPGPSGFRRTHHQAQATRSLATAGDLDSPAVSYGDQGVAICSVLARDLDTTRLWVQEVLGGLAIDTESHSRLRETLRVFLSTDGSYTEAAEILNLHRNSVKYRVLKAGEERGRPIAGDRLDVELALQVCRFLGTSVLFAGQVPQP